MPTSRDLLPASLTAPSSRQTVVGDDDRIQFGVYMSAEYEQGGPAVAGVETDAKAVPIRAAVKERRLCKFGTLWT